MQPEEVPFFFICRGSLYVGVALVQALVVWPGGSAHALWPGPALGDRWGTGR